MAELKVYLSEELDKRFRMLAMSIFGYGRGSLSEAAVEALNSWCVQHENQNSHSHQVASPASESDPAARAEERPLTPALSNEKETTSAVKQSSAKDNTPPDNNGKVRNRSDTDKAESE